MKKFSEFITSEVKTVALMGHEHPDGDCAGSVLGTWHYMKKVYPEISVTAFLEPLTENISFLKGYSKFGLAEAPVREDSGEGEVYDLAISLDCAAIERIGAGKAAFAGARKTLCIDHHATNTKFAEDNLVMPKRSSNCEILCDIFDMSKVDRDTAICLYTGMAHDTGVYRYEAVTSATLIKAAALMRKKVPFSEIIRESISEGPYDERKVAAKILSDSTLYRDEGFLYALASEEFQRENNVNDTQLGGVVSYLNGVKEAEVVLFMYKKSDGAWKGSLRTKAIVDATAIAGHFKGGGHVRAAGFNYCGDPMEAVRIVRGLVKEMLSEKRE